MSATMKGLLSNWKIDLKASVVEFVGTVMFLLFGLGGIQAAAFAENASTSNSTVGVKPIAQMLYIATSLGLSLMVAAWAFYRVSGSIFNPNVALALLLSGAVAPFRFILYVIAEIAGSIVAAALLKAMSNGELAIAVAIAPGINKAQAVFIEMFLTAGLTITVLFLAAEKHKATYLAPVGIGLSLFIGQLWGVQSTGAAMSTVRAFGPAVVMGFSSDHWVYWVGPFLGSLLATALYFTFKLMDYESFVPAQDSADGSDSAQPPVLQSGCDAA